MSFTIQSESERFLCRKILINNSIIYLGRNKNVIRDSDFATNKYLIHSQKTSFRTNKLNSKILLEK